MSKKHILISSCLVCLFLVILLLGYIRKNHKNTGSQNVVPLSYTALYDGFDKGLTELNSLLDTKFDSNRTHVTFGAQALIANGNRGEELLNTDAISGVILELENFKKLGIQGVTVAIPYPLLVPSYHNSDKYLNFFKQVVSEVRKRNMKLDIETAFVFSKTDFSRLNVDYSKLTLSQYNKEKHDMAQLIIDELSPDYLNLGSEPDTFANLSGLTELKDPIMYANHINYLLSGLKRGNTSVGAGGSSWLSIEFMKLLAKDTSVDFLSIHLYPLNKEILENISQTVQLAKQYNKRLILDEAWLYKSAPKESVSNVAATSAIFKRDLYSFWQPQDQKFLSALVKLAKLSNIEYISPFWSRNFFTYIDYGPSIDSLSYDRILSTYNQQLIKDMTAGSFSSTGLFYKDLIQQNQ